MSVLRRIIADKRAEVGRSKERLPLSVLAPLAEAAPPPKDFRGALQTGSSPRIIAEVKRASPSKGLLRPGDAVGDWRPKLLAERYAAGGACCLSVLTDVQWFWGHPDHLAACSAATGLPTLRKDFIIDAYQVDESRWLGADAILLIAGVMDESTLLQSATRAAELGMAVLLEIHADSELPQALAIEHAIIGVNHRDLHSFDMDMQRAIRLRSKIPADRLMVAESGLKTRADIEPLMDQGVEAFLIGEGLAASTDPEQALRTLCG